MKETKVYAIEDREDIYELSDEQFIEIAEDSSHTWSLFDFQRELNSEGSHGENKQFWVRGRSYYYVRFIDVDIIGGVE